MAETAWAYCAVSSSEQEGTLDDQRAWAKHIAEANGWTITRTFGADKAGWPRGKDGVRKLLEVLVTELEQTPKAQRPARILLIRLDRVGRMALDSIGVLARIRKLGVTLHDRETGDIKLETVADSLGPIFKLITAEMENAVRSDKWKAVHARRRAAGLHIGNVPFGMTLENGKAVPIEPEASFVREVFRLAAEGWGIRRIRKWASKNAPPKKLKDRESQKSFGESTIRYLLRSKTLRGSVVPIDLWERAMEARAAVWRLREPRKHPWPLQGAIQCVCGARLYGHHSNGYAYYVCRTHEGKEQVVGHRADALEASFVGVLKGLRADPNVWITKTPDAALDALRTQGKVLKKQLAELDGRRKRAMELAGGGRVHLGPNCRERLDGFSTARKQVESELEAIESRLSAADRQQASTIALTDALSGSSPKPGPRDGLANSTADRPSYFRYGRRSLYFTRPPRGAFHDGSTIHGLWCS